MGKSDDFIERKKLTLLLIFFHFFPPYIISFLTFVADSHIQEDLLFCGSVLLFSINLILIWNFSLRLIQIADLKLIKWFLVLQVALPSLFFQSYTGFWLAIAYISMILVQHNGS